MPLTTAAAAGVGTGSILGPGTAAAFHTLGHGALGLIYSSSFLYAGFIGLGALWLASYVGHGGYTGVLSSDYDYYDYEGYGDYGGYGGYGGYQDHDDGYGMGYHRREHDEKHPKGPKRRTGQRNSHRKDRRKSGWFRKKRSADEFFGPELLDRNSYGNFDNSVMSATRNEEEQLVEQLKRSDRDNCGMRLVCELSGIRHRALSREEWDILQFIRSGDVRFDSIRPGQGVRRGSPVLRDYQTAATFGARRGSCLKRYKRCRLSASDMMALIRVLKK